MLPMAHRLDHRAAMICWHHLFGWPVLRGLARLQTAIGNHGGAAFLTAVADRATPALPEWED